MTSRLNWADCKIGDRVPFTASRSITGTALPSPVWHALVVPPGKENAASKMLGENGVHAIYPTRESRYRSRGKAIVRKLPIITRVVYARFNAEPQWDVMKARRLITGVYSHGDRPIAIPYPVIRAIEGLPVHLAQLEAAQEAMLRVTEGDRAEIVGGPMSGFCVDVTRVADGRVWFSTVAGVRGEVSVAKVKKVLPSGPRATTS